MSRSRPYQRSRRCGREKALVAELMKKRHADVDHHDAYAADDDRPRPEPLSLDLVAFRRVAAGPGLARARVGAGPVFRGFRVGMPLDFEDGWYRGGRPLTDVRVEAGRVAECYEVAGWYAPMHGSVRGRRCVPGEGPDASFLALEDLARRQREEIERTVRSVYGQLWTAKAMKDIKR